MTSRGKDSHRIKLDERNHVEKPLPDQLTGKVRVTPLLNVPQEADA